MGAEFWTGGGTGGALRTGGAGIGAGIGAGTGAELRTGGLLGTAPEGDALVANIAPPELGSDGLEEDFGGGSKEPGSKAKLGSSLSARRSIRSPPGFSSGLGGTVTISDASSGEGIAGVFGGANATCNAPALGGGARDGVPAAGGGGGGGVENGGAETSSWESAPGSAGAAEAEACGTIGSAWGEKAGGFVGAGCGRPLPSSGDETASDLGGGGGLGGGAAALALASWN